jgi:23S rRNA (cytosine1962-C5)-methyltransferase
MSLFGLTIAHAGLARLAAGHPQLPLTDAEPGQRIEPGRPVRLRSVEDDFLGVGVCDPENQLIRVWDLAEQRDLGLGFFRSRVRRALGLRQTLGLARAGEAYRLVNGEGDGLSGLSMDVYGAFGVVAALSRGLSGHARLLAEAARAELAAVGLGLRGVVLKTRSKAANADAEAAAAAVAAASEPGSARKGAASAPAPQASTAGGGPVKDVVLGEDPPAKWQVLEGGIPYEIHLRGGYNVGLFTDMREHRAGLLRFVRGARVLNTFAYTGSLSLAAARGGARAVTSVDLAAGPLAWARENFRLSGLDPEAPHLRWEVCDVFKFLERERAAARGDPRREPYDVVILDPPTVSGARATSWAQKRDYPELIAAAAGLMPGGGHLWISSNTHGGPGIMKHVEAGLKLARRRGAVLELGGLPPDYPTPISWPSARYLEVCQLRVWPADETG